MRNFIRVLIFIDFLREKTESDEVRDHCHLTGRNRGPAHNECNDKITQKHSNFIPFIFHSFTNYDCHLLFKKLFDKKKDKVKFDIIPKNKPKIHT